MAPIIDKVLGLRCASYGSLYDCMLALRGWQREEINGNKYELNSIITEKWEGKAYRLVIQRERRMGGEQSDFSTYYITSGFGDTHTPKPLVRFGGG